MLVICLTATLALAATVDLPGSDREIVLDDSAAALVEDGLRALRDRRLDESARTFAALAEGGGGADVRYLEALARYEAGDLRRAARAAEAGLALDGDNGPLLSLSGLVLADQGQGDRALPRLAKAVDLARAGGDRSLEARAILNMGLVHLDRGEASVAETHFSEARRLAEALGDQGVVAIASENLAIARAARGSGGGDLDARVGERIRKGQLDGARQLLSEPPSGDRRALIRWRLARASVRRAAGELDAAAADLYEALAAAREGGLTRETANALAQLGTTYLLAGKPGVARDHLEEAIALVSGTSFRAAEVGYRAEAGRVASRLDDAAAARAQLGAARLLVDKVEDAGLRARLDELEGEIEARAGRASAASSAFQRALASFDASGWCADGARVATAGVDLAAALDTKSLEHWKTQALSRFERCGDALGPAHVAVAEGLGFTRAKQIEPALAAFSRAVDMASKVSGGRGASVAEIARRNAAEALLALGHDPDAVRADGINLAAAVERHAAFVAAEAAYREGVSRFDLGDFAGARARFDAAYLTFERLGESANGRTARVSRAWAWLNEASVLEPEARRRSARDLVAEAESLGEPEIRARARVTASLAAAEVGRDALPELRLAAEDAEKLGLTAAAGRVWAELAEREAGLDSRAGAARRAHALLGAADAVGPYAMYSVAVDAYNDGSFGLAIALSEEVLPTAGQLADAVRAVLEAARAQVEG